MLRKDFFREIGRNAGRFISIFFIVLLGTAFYAGIRSSSYDMKYSADCYYDEARLMDIRVLGSLGLTDQDLEDMRAVSGVKSVTGGHTQEVLCDTQDQELVLKMIALTEDVNCLTLQQGRLPEKEDECVADVVLLEQKGYQIGDTITVESGTEDSLEDSLTQLTYTIVGAGNLPYYVDLTRGVGSIGDGSIDAFLVVQPQVFKQEVYTEAYVLVQGAEELLSYSDSYEDLVEEAVDRLEAISDKAVDRRYQEVYAEAEEELEDARKKVEDGQKELDDAKAELEDGQRQLAEAETTLQDKEQELKDGQAELAQGEEELADSRQQLEDGRRQIQEAEDQLAQSEQTLADGWAQYQAGLAQYEENKASFDQKRAEYDQGLAAYTAGETQYEQQYQAYQAAAAQYQAMGLDPASDPQLQEAKAQLDAARQELDGTKSQLDAAALPIGEAEAQLTAAKATLDATETQLAQGQAALESGRQELEAKKAELTSGEAQIQSGEAELAQARAQLEDGQKQLEDARQELEDKKQELAQGQADYQEAYAEAQPELEDARQQIADGQKELEELEAGQWYVLDRNKISSCASYGQDAERMKNLGQVFPVMFFLVAALVSLTAMTRMVEEQRLQIGTLKALGYKNRTIAMKYFSYAMLATVSGSIVGVLLGEQLLPYVVLDSYQMMYTGMLECRTPINWDQGIMALAAAAASTGIATLAACLNQLRAKPAELMRPEAPKGGKRVFLERITFLWKRLSFTHKSTLRNLIRYKKRFFMTIIGIGGCMALMLVGFGLEDSITEIAKRQYVDIFTYDASVTLNSKATDQDLEAFTEAVEDKEEVAGCLPIYQTSVDLEAGDNTRSAYLYVPSDTQKIAAYLTLKDRKTGEGYAYPQEGVALAEKTAKMLEVSVGDTIEIKTSEDSSPVSVQVTEIVENYIQHYAFLSPATYEDLFGEKPDYNTMYINYKEEDKEDQTVQEQKLGRELMGWKACSGVSFVSELEGQIQDMLQSLNIVIYVLICSAGLLAFVVLYNLNSINITERQRELATLKVLGFYDGEVAWYVYRENILLTIIGILVGAGMGAALHRVTILTVEVDLMMFGRVISFLSYLKSGIITLFFSVLVNGVMFYRLRRINMIESLKSVE